MQIRIESNTRSMYISEGPEMINYDHNDSFKWVSSAFAFFFKGVLMDSCLVFCCSFFLSRPVPLPFSALTSGHNVQPYVGSFICSPSAPTWQSISLARQLHYDYGLVLFAYSHFNWMHSNANFYAKIVEIVTMTVETLLTLPNPTAACFPAPF